MINVRERDQIWNCPGEDIAVDDPPDTIPSPGVGANLPAPFPAIVTKELQPGTPAPPPGPGPTPPPPGFFYNEEIWVTATCGDPEPTNTVSFLIPARIVIASTQAGANAAAQAIYLPLVQAQLNCSTVTLVGLTPEPDAFEVTGFDQFQYGGYWFSDPQPFLNDGFIVNQ